MLLTFSNLKTDNFLLSSMVEANKISEKVLFSHLKSALDSSPLCVILAEAPDGKVTYANDAARNFVGQTESNLLSIEQTSYSQNWAVYTEEGEIVESEHMPLSRSLSTGEVIANEVYRLALRDGTQKWSLTSSSPIFDENGDIIASMVMWLDITEQKLLEEDLQRKASFDYLTGAYSRQKITELAERSLARALLDQSNLSFLLIDLDHFKRVNDTHGHPIGDDVLVKFVHLTLSSLRPGDLFGRFGGEEFLAILKTDSVDNGVEVAEKLRQRIAQTPLETDVGKIDLTVSIGVLSINALQEPLYFDQVIQHVDRALYQAKESGRNRVREIIL